jgi:penicillin-binding protein 1A
MLRAVITSGTGVHAAIPGRDLAGKTGTTSDSKDAWFCGFSANLTTVVWVGRDDARPMTGVMGGGPPTAIWRGFMTAALKRTLAEAIPAGPPAVVAAAPVAVPSQAQDVVEQLLAPGAGAAPAATQTEQPQGPQSPE